MPAQDIDWMDIHGQLMDVLRNASYRKLNLDLLLSMPLSDAAKDLVQKNLEAAQQDENKINSLLQFVSAKNAEQMTFGAEDTPLTGRTASMTSNLKRYAQTKSYEGHLRDNSNDHGHEGNALDANTDFQLSQDDRPGHRHKDKTDNFTTEEQLDKVRTGANEHVVDKALDNNDKLYLDRRFDKSWDSPVNHPANRVAEGYDQKRLEEYREANKRWNRDTEFWTNDVASQMLGEKTTIVDNVQKTQLQNLPDRFSDMDESMPTDTDYQKNLKNQDRKEKVEKMVMASLKDADAMLFHIYAVAAQMERDLTPEEQQIVRDINCSKARMFTLLEQMSDQTAGA